MIAGIVRASVAQRLLVLVVTASLIVVGVLTAQNAQVDVLPDLTRPTVSIQTEAPGLAPEDAESLVTYPMETAVSGLPGIRRLRSVTTPGLSIVYAEFDWTTDPLRDRQLVSERVDALRAPLAPYGEPRVGPLASLMGEILLVALQSSGGTTSPRDLRSLADWVLRPRLLAVPGVAQVLAIGGEVAQIDVEPDLPRMQMFGVTLAQINETVRGLGTNAAAGIVTGTGAEYAVRTRSASLDLSELAQAAVAWQGTGAVRLGQVSKIVLGSRPKRGDAGFNGEPAVILSVQKQPGTDTRRLTRDVQDALASLDTALPHDVKRATVFRQADFIEQSVDNLRESLLLGSLAVALVLMLFLSGARAALVSLAAIPVSAITAMLLLQAFGMSVNTMTLGGIAIAAGEFVDDAVVGVENTLRRLRAVASTAPVAVARTVVDATIEVRSAILYATLLTVLVLVPLFALGGVEGRLFVPLAAAYIAGMLASLVVAITLTPALASFAFDRATPGMLRERGWVRALKSRYARGLSALIARPMPLYLACAALALCALAGLARLPRTFLPAFGERTLTINLLLEPGVSLELSNQVGRAAESIVLGLPDVQSVGRRTGRTEGDEHAEGVNYSELDVALRPTSRPRTQVVADLRQRLSVLPANLVFGQPIAHRLDHLLSGVRAPVVVKLLGDDVAVLTGLARSVAERLQSVPGLRDVQAEKVALVPELQVTVDARHAAQYGASPPRVQEALSELTVGTALAHIVDGPRRLDLCVRLSPELLTPDLLSTVLLPTAQGPVPLGWLGTTAILPGPNQLLRENLQRRVVVSASLDEQASADLLGVIQGALQGVPIPAGYQKRLEGELPARAVAERRMQLLAAVAFALMVAVLFARYRSLSLVLVAVSGIPLSLCGGVVALLLTGTALSLASQIGFITLTGIAARNGILKVQRCLDLGASARYAPTALLVSASQDRLTPALMTASIAAAALLPLLWSADAAGKEILHPVAVVLFGGLVLGTALDSFATPVLFAHLARARAARTRCTEEQVSQQV